MGAVRKANTTNTSSRKQTTVNAGKGTQQRKQQQEQHVDSSGDDSDDDGDDDGMFEDMMNSGDEEEESVDDNNDDEGGEMMEDVNEDIEEDKAERLPIKQTKQYMNNSAGLREKLTDIDQPLSKTFLWHERMNVSSSAPVLPEEDVHDDFKRELAFYQQALASVVEGRQRLIAARIKMQRPDDFFAEMMKTDDHMNKVRRKLVSDKEAMERSELARRQRDYKKFGKAVQTQVTQDRQKAKKEALDAVKKQRKNRKNAVGAADEDDSGFNVGIKHDVSAADEARANNKKSAASSKHSREARDQKFGFGGKKRHAKGNTAASSADMSGFSSRKNKGRGGGAGKANKNSKPQRPGKSRRANMK